MLNGDQPYTLSLAQSSHLIRERKLAPSELLASILQRIEETEPKVHAYVWVEAESAQQAAKRADQEISSGQWKGPLHGIPYSLKDLFHTKGVPTEAGSRVMEGYKSVTNSGAGDRLDAEGGILLGKTLTHEFAYGRDTPATRNPWNLDYFPGASSAGSGVSVAVDSAMVALGTDTAGSIRIPGSMNGIVALKPTFGRVSKRGVIPMSAILDNVGPLAKTVEDAAIVLQAIAGHDSMDPTSLRDPVDNYTANLRSGVEETRVGIDRDYFMYPTVEPDVRKRVEEALQLLISMGATVVEVSIPYIEFAMDANMTICAVDMSSYHQKWLRDRGHLYNKYTRTMLEMGELILGTDYLRALQVRRSFKHSVRDVFNEHRLDALIAPTTPITAFPREELGPLPLSGGETPLVAMIHHCSPFDLSGQPAISVPCGFSGARLPVGLQVIGRPLDESTLFRIAYAYESATEWHLQSPPI